MKLLRAMLQGGNARRCLAVLLGVAGLVLACGTETPTQVGRDLRAHPDTLYLKEIRDVQLDSVFHIPVSLGNSNTAQVGQRRPYTAHVLYDFKVPTRVVQSTDTLGLDTATFVISTDSLTQLPYTGSMRFGLHEVVTGRTWATIRADSALPLPSFAPTGVAPDLVVPGSQLLAHPPKLSFAVNLHQVAGFDTVRTQGGTLDFNVALVFKGFDVPGLGFFEYPYAKGTTPTAQFIGFSDSLPGGAAIETLAPARHRTFVDYDSTYSFGNHLVVSDGHRLHSLLRFKPLRNTLPESASVHLAELVLTEVDTTQGLLFGSGEIGVLAPSDSTKIFNKATNEAGVFSKTTVAALPRAQITLPVSGLVFSMQEKARQDNGFLLRLATEGVKVRHFEFYGGAAPDSLKPLLRVLYSLPARFEGGER